jgi:predicted dehydrogenase
VTDRLRAGIIGTGFTGTVHAHAVRAAGEAVSWVAAPSPERSADAAARLGTRPACSADDLIDACDIDVVHVCTPDTTDVPLARRASAADKPMLREKPLALTLDEAWTLPAAARSQVATVPVVSRFYPASREARARIAADTAGSLRLVNGGFLQDWQADRSGVRLAGAAGREGQHRAFIDIREHWCDLVKFTTGPPMTRTLARRSGAGTTCIMRFATDGGADGSLIVSQTAQGRRNMPWFSRDGAQAAHGFNQEYPENLITGRLDGNLTPHRGSRGVTAAPPVTRSCRPGTRRAHQNCFNAFVADTYAALSGPAAHVRRRPAHHRPGRGGHRLIRSSAWAESRTHEN